MAFYITFLLPLQKNVSKFTRAFLQIGMYPCDFCLVVSRNIPHVVDNSKMELSVSDNKQMLLKYAFVK